jgi:hypothetical protein
MARVMVRSERSVEWHRMNVRKKMGLGREQDLGEALARF